MKVLIVDDEHLSRELIKKILNPYGDCHEAADGEKAIQAFTQAWESGTPFDLICLDIVMPNMDGHEVLRQIRTVESELGVSEDQAAKVVMFSSLGDPQNVIDAFCKGGAGAYVVKPIKKEVVLQEMRKIGLIEQVSSK